MVAEGWGGRSIRIGTCPFGSLPLQFPATMGLMSTHHRATANCCFMGHYVLEEASTTGCSGSGPSWPCRRTCCFTVTRSCVCPRSHWGLADRAACAPQVRQATACVYILEYSLI